MLTIDERLKRAGKLQCAKCSRYFESLVHLSYHIKKVRDQGVPKMVCMDEDEMIFGRRMEYRPTYGAPVWRSMSERPRIKLVPPWVQQESAA